MNFDDIEDAFLFVSMMPQLMHSAILCKDTGKIYYVSEFGDSDELPEDLDDDMCIEIPHKNELGLGKRLVQEFVSQHMPDDLEEVNQIFRRKGAYARYKELLDRRGLLDDWHSYEDKRTESALREWCAENNIEIEG